MNYNQIGIRGAGLLLLGAMAIAAWADDSPWPETDRIELGSRLGFGTAIKLRNIGAASAPHNPSVTGRSYTDGFVGTDSTGNAGGVTSYWGYQNASQAVDANAYLLMHNSASGALGTLSSGDMTPGLELTWDHQFKKFGCCRLGLETAFSWSGYGVHGTMTAPAGVLSVDGFPLGYAPPAAPYTGPTAPGPFIPLIGTTALGIPVTTASTFNSDMYGLRVGPYLDVPLNKSLLLTFSGGLAVDLADSEFSFTQGYALPGGGASSVKGRATDVGAVAGGYISVQGSLKLTRHVNLFTGFEFEGADNFRLRARNVEATLDMGSALFWTVGASYSF